MMRWVTHALSALVSGAPLLILFVAVFIGIIAYLVSKTAGKGVEECYFWLIMTCQRCFEKD